MHLIRSRTLYFARIHHGAALFVPAAAQAHATTAARAARLAAGLRAAGYPDVKIVEKSA